MKLILATNNQNKLREFREVLEPLGYEVLSQSEAGVSADPEENGKTFRENAYIKAKAVYDLCGEPVIADDSGLEVDALNGEPGVYSARYAEPGHRIEKLLKNLEGVPDEKRTARFRCCICYLDKEGDAFFAEGTCEGKIGYEKRGSNGFGYDPVFMVGDKSMAEMTADEKNAISHRGNAIRALAELLAKNNDNTLLE